MDNFETKSPVAAPAAQPAVEPPKAELRNSLWCVHTANGRVGMINELHSGIATFHYAIEHGDNAGGLEEGVQVRQEELRVAKASELPAHLEFTPQQLRDIGYF